MDRSFGSGLTKRGFSVKTEGSKKEQEASQPQRVPWRVGYISNVYYGGESRYLCEVLSFRFKANSQFCDG